MLSNLSIRAKITVVIAFLLVTMTGLGLLAVSKMLAINASTEDIQNNWLPSVRSLGAVQVGTMTYRTTVRGHMLGETAADKEAQDKRLATTVTEIADARKKYERYIS